MKKARRPARRLSRGRAASLSRERIVEVALTLVEREGLESFSTRNLGRELGCEAMSIYHFFPSKQHLVDALVDRVIGTVEIPGDDVPPREAVARLARGYRAMAHRHARLFPLVAVHRLNTPAGVRFIESVLGVIRRATGSDEAAARHFRALGYYLMGVGLDETSGYARGPSAAEPVSDAYIAEHCPRLAQAARYFGREAWDRTFEVGLAALLDAMERSARSP